MRIESKNIRYDLTEQFRRQMSKPVSTAMKSDTCRPTKVLLDATIASSSTVMKMTVSIQKSALPLIQQVVVIYTNL